MGDSRRYFRGPTRAVRYCAGLAVTVALSACDMDMPGDMAMNFGNNLPDSIHVSVSATGAVRDYVTGRPLSGVSIGVVSAIGPPESLEAVPEAVKVATSTDVSGIFSAEVSYSGSFFSAEAPWLFVGHPGYQFCFDPVDDCGYPFDSCQPVAAGSWIRMRGLVGSGYSLGYHSTCDIIGIDAEQLGSSVGLAPDLQGVVSEVVECVVREGMVIPEWYVVTREFLAERIPRLRFTPFSSSCVSPEEVVDMTGLDLCADLRVLSFYYVRLSASSIDVISRLPNLETLDLGSTWISDLAPLAKLHTLKALSIHGNPVQDLSPLTRLPLLYLQLSGTEVVDLSPLLEIQSLRCVGLPFDVDDPPADSVPVVEELRRRGVTLNIKEESCVKILGHTD